LAAEIDRVGALQQLPKIINAEGDDQEAAQRIGHGMKTVALDKKNIQEGDYGVR
jgi:hypothetical protein